MDLMIQLILGTGPFAKDGPHVKPSAMALRRMLTCIGHINHVQFHLYHADILVHGGTIAGINCD
jgi:hypothetical protein